MSAGPGVVSVQLLGQVTSVTAIVVQFNESLDPASAGNVKAYAFGHNPPQSSSSSFNITDFLFRKSNHPMPAVVRPKLVVAGKIVFSSAVYDDATDTVTLTPVAPFRAPSWFRYLRVKGIGPNAIKDTSGVALNDGKDTESRWFMHAGRTVRWIDPQHNHVTLKLTGPGKMNVFLRGGNRQPTIFITGGTAATTLSGTVKNGRALLPFVNVAQIEGADGINNLLLNNSSFHVFVTTP